MAGMVCNFFTCFLFGVLSSLPLALIISAIFQVRKNISDDLSA